MPNDSEELPPSIEVRNLTKEFRRPRRRSGRFAAVRTLLATDHEVVRAVDDISFTVRAGEAVGCIGSNGAGKSTTIKMLTGVLAPTSGTVRLDGRDPAGARKETARRIGVVFGQRSQLWWDLPLVESLELVADIHGVEPARYRRNLARAEAVLGLSDFLTTPVRQLSLGRRVRGDLAAAVLHDPAVLFLDEPTIGLDVHTRDRVIDFVRSLNGEQGTTVVLTTHDLADIERLCRRVILIDAGSIAYDGTVTRLKAAYRARRTLTVTYDAVEAGDAGSAVFAAGRTLGEGTVVEASPGRVRVALPASASAVPAILAEVGQRCAVTDLSIDENSLENVVKELYATEGGFEALAAAEGADR
ncbi:ABC transporter ATP-binding protein [Streptomyces genisteinicus]|uniref:ABC transporter ATP-binding protein n=1 Tax=Streptomyces genisteinicus TaxID=2768068 RepID=UPI001FE3C11D|nr:ATP-binding cassette domain-containing protein [Streptomyces genisteinicus]